MSVQLKETEDGRAKVKEGDTGIPMAGFMLMFGRTKQQIL